MNVCDHLNFIYLYVSFRGTNKKSKRCGYSKSEKNTLGYKAAKVGYIERILFGENISYLILSISKISNNFRAGREPILDKQTYHAQNVWRK